MTTATATAKTAPTPDLPMLQRQLAELLDREAIRSVLYEYCRAADRGDAALMKACYHPDGTDDHGFFVGRGWDFADYVLPILAQLERSIHSLTNTHIVFDAGGRKAHVETQWSAIHRLPRWGKLTDMWHQGRYLDEFEKRDGSRKILRRVTVLDAERWIDTADLQRLVLASTPNQVHRGRRGSDDPVSGNAGGTPALAQCVRRTTRRQRGDPRSPHRPGTTTHH